RRRDLRLKFYSSDYLVWSDNSGMRRWIFIAALGAALLAMPLWAQRGGYGGGNYGHGYGYGRYPYYGRYGYGYRGYGYGYYGYPWFSVGWYGGAGYSGAYYSYPDT